jgi:hypothetical protein
MNQSIIKHLLWNIGSITKDVHSIIFKTGIIITFITLSVCNSPWLIPSFLYDKSTCCTSFNGFHYSAIIENTTVLIIAFIELFTSTEHLCSNFLRYMNILQGYIRI